MAPPKAPREDVFKWGTFAMIKAIIFSAGRGETRVEGIFP